MENKVIKRLFGEQITIFMDDETTSEWIIDRLNPVNANEYTAVISKEFIQISQNVSIENEHGIGVWCNIYPRERLSKINIDSFSDGDDWINDYETLPCLEMLLDGTLIIKMFNLHSPNNKEYEKEC